MAVPQFATSVYDAALAAIRSNCTRVVALSAEAANYAEATTNVGTGSGKLLGSVTVVAGDFTIQAGTGGVLRELAFAGKTGGVGQVAGGPTVIAFLDVANSSILAQTVENGAALIEAAGAVSFPAIKVMQFVAPTSV